MSRPQQSSSGIRPSSYAKVKSFWKPEESARFPIQMHFERPSHVADRYLLIGLLSRALYGVQNTEYGHFSLTFPFPWIGLIYDAIVHGVRNVFPEPDPIFNA